LSNHQHLDLKHPKSIYFSSLRRFIRLIQLLVYWHSWPCIWDWICCCCSLLLFSVSIALFSLGFWLFDYK